MDGFSVIGKPNDSNNKFQLVQISFCEEYSTRLHAKNTRWSTKARILALQLHKGLTFTLLINCLFTKAATYFSLMAAHPTNGNPKTKSANLAISVL